MILLLVVVIALIEGSILSSEILLITNKKEREHLDQARYANETAPGDDHSRIS